MSEIKLNMRYPESRLEDVTDAYTRGFEVGLAMRADENAKLRELVRDMWDWLAPTAIGGGAPMQRIAARMRELGVEV